MPRMARAVVASVPHHVTQRGNRRQRTFFIGGWPIYEQAFVKWERDFFRGMFPGCPIY